MAETKKGLLPWPIDTSTEETERQSFEDFYRRMKSEGKIALVQIVGEGSDVTARFVRESWQKRKGDEEQGSPVITDAEPTDCIVFGLPHAGPFGIGKPVAQEGNKVVMSYTPLEEIEGFKVKWIGPDVANGCGVYLRLDAYDPTVDVKGAQTKELLGVR